jgi:carboxylesterase type B
VYRLDWTNDDLMAKRLGSPHTLDVPLVFATGEQYMLTDLTGDEARAVSEAMQTAWASFISGHAPVVRGLEWTTFSDEHPDVLIFDRVNHVARDLDSGRWAAWRQAAAR